MKSLACLPLLLLAGCASVHESGGGWIVGGLGRNADHDALRSRASLIGLAALMYGADHGGALPSPRDFRPGLRPYVVRGGGSVPYRVALVESLDRLAWSYPGGVPSRLGPPSRTELGRLAATDGCAVLYADGHARWLGRP